jgi:hypothetical protein
MPDMWYLEGDWKSKETNDSVKFETSIKTLDARQVMADLSKGLEIFLTANGTDKLDAIAISLDNNKLFVRRVTKELKEEISARAKLNK